MKKTIALIAIIAALYSCSSNSNSSAKDSIGVDASKAVVRKPDSTQSGAKDSTKTVSKDSASSGSTGWNYEEKTDKMTSKTNYYASVIANEQLDFPFPYDGGSQATLTIRNLGDGNDAVLDVSKGQFTNVTEDGIKIRFDNDPPVKYSASETSDGSTNVIFIEGTKKLIKKLKTSSKIIIQAEFYESGSKTMEFNVSNLKWEH